MTLVNPHPALKASVPINPMVDVWKGDDWFHNGAFRQEMISYVYGQTATKKSDEDWFSGTYDDYTTFLRYGSPGAYGGAMGMGQLPFWVRLTQHPAYDEYWQLQAVDRILARTPLTVPTLLVDSLWDQEDIYGAPAVFDAVKRNDHGNAHLVLGPWHHGQANGQATSLGPFDWGSDTGKWFRHNVMLPFLDEHLKNGPPANTARVTAFEAGTNQWQRLDDWPQACMRSCPANLRRSISPLPAPSASPRPKAGRSTPTFRIPPGPSPTARAQSFALGPGFDLALLARGRSALRRGPPRRPHLFEPAARPATEACRHPTRPPCRFD